MSEIEQWIRKAREVEIHKAGNAQGLIDWYNNGADGQINWGSEGDFQQCVDIAGKYIQNPEGFCQLRHMDATGAPTGKAPGELAKADDTDYGKVISSRKGEPDDQDLYNKVKAEARKKFDVYPSAVANGWVVQEYKRRGGTYSVSKASEDSFTPPKGVQEAAQKALEWMKDGKAGDGFTSVGRKRAGDLANGHAVSMDTVKRMKAYFDRHQSDKDSPHWDEPSPGKVAWYAWGGDAGYSWAKGIVASKVEKGDLPGHDFHGNQWVTEGGRFAGGSAGSSTKPKLQLPSSQRGRAKFLATALNQRAVQNEPEITREINETIQQFGGERVKPEFAFKEPDSITRKLMDDAHEYLDTKVGQVEDAATNLGDALRYTIKFNGGDFTSSVQKALDDFKSEGFEAVKVKNFFNDDPNNTYRGINCQFRDTTTNQLFEVQFHTPESAAMVDTVHPIYEATRVLPETSPEYAAGQAKMASMWAAVPNPVGIESIGRRSVKG